MWSITTTNVLYLWIIYCILTEHDVAICILISYADLYFRLLAVTVEILWIFPPDFWQLQKAWNTCFLWIVLYQKSSFLETVKIHWGSTEYLVLREDNFENYCLSNALILLRFVIYSHILLWDWLSFISIFFVKMWSRSTKNYVQDIHEKNRKRKTAGFLLIFLLWVWY